MDDAQFKLRIKEMMVENLMLKSSAAEIGDEQPLSARAKSWLGFGGRPSANWWLRWTRIMA